jgi:2-polyprenyl-6-methoxyphenol hydroxylase-like FAD-dependent oxidoreductase
MMAQSLSTKAIKEPSRETKVCREADVIVVGGGPGGHAAAVSAARNGADTVLMERYGHLGGMGTGGLVTIIPNLSDMNGLQQIAGQCQEWIDRLDVREATDYPDKEEWGSTDQKTVSHWRNRSFFCERLDRVVYSVHVDAEILKCVLNDMVEEAGVNVYLHSWGTEPIMDGNKVRGVIFQSKSGRQAILGKVVIDATGDGDLLPYAGVDFESDIPPHFRIANLALCFWVAGVDFKKAEDFRLSQSQKFAAQSQELIKLGGYPGYLTCNLRNQESIVWFHNRHPNSSQIDVEELTRIEFEGRKKMLITHDYRKKCTPGFEKSFIVLTAPQLGIRSSRRMIGEYKLTEKDLKSNEIFADTIAILPDLDRGQESIKHPLMYIPFRSLLPCKTENLLVACRAFSSDALVQEFFNLIPHCIAFGEAAGTAAALAVKDRISVRNVNFETLRNQLIKQGVILPDV